MFLKKDQPFFIILFPILIGTVFYLLNMQVNSNQLIVTKLGLWGEIKGLNYSLTLFISSIFLSINGLLLNLIFNRNRFEERNNFSIGLIYLLLILFLNLHGANLKYILSETFLILSIYHFINIENNQDSRRQIFNASLFSGIVVSFIPEYIFLFVVSFILLFYIRPFVIREVTLLITGFIIPLAYGIANVLFQHTTFTLPNFKEIKYSFGENEFYLNIIFISCYFLVYLLSLIAIRKKLSKSSVKFRKSVNILRILNLTLVLFAFYNILADSNYEFIGASALCTSLLIPNTLGSKGYQFFIKFFIGILISIFIARFFI